MRIGKIFLAVLPDICYNFVKGGKSYDFYVYWQEG